MPYCTTKPRRVATLLACLLSALPVAAQPRGIITTIAGAGTTSVQGTNALATGINARGNPVIAPNGDVFFTDAFSHSLLRLSGGILTTVAGTGRAGFSGDGGPAVNAQLNNPTGLARDAAGNLYVADTGNRVVRLISPDGRIRTVAGSGANESSGDNGPATAAGLVSPVGLALDRGGNLYIADEQAQRVRLVSPAGIITTVVGSGRIAPLGDDGPAANAGLQAPAAVAVDANGTVYVLERTGSRVRRVLSGTITTVAGNGRQGFGGDNGPATIGSFNTPTGLAVEDNGALLIADQVSRRVRRVTPDGLITTVAGTGANNFSGDGGAATQADLLGPIGIAARPGGGFLFTDGGLRLRQVDGAGRITTIAGSGNLGFGGDGVPAVSATFGLPVGVAADASGNVYVSDIVNHRVRRITPAGLITTLAGTGDPGFSGDGGPATAAQLFNPVGLAVDRRNNLYIADQGNRRVRRVSPDGVITTTAGTGVFGFSGDNGPAVNANLGLVSGLAVDPNSILYVTDVAQGRVRRVDLNTGSIRTFAGNARAADPFVPGQLATETSLRSPVAVAADSAGTVYIADERLSRVLRIGPDEIVTVFAGNGQDAPAGAGPVPGENGTAAVAAIGEPTGLALDRGGNLYVTARSRRVFAVTPGGVLTRIAGTGEAGATGDGGPPLSATFGFGGPRDLAFDVDGGLLIVDNGNRRVRKILASAPQLRVPAAPLAFTLDLPTGNTTAEQSLQLQASSAGLSFSLTATTETGGNWLTVAPDRGTLPASVSVRVSAAGLAPGTYRGTVIVSSPGASPASVLVPVTLTVAGGIVPPRLLGVSASSFTLRARAQGDVVRTFAAVALGGDLVTPAIESTTSSGGAWLQARLVRSPTGPSGTGVLVVEADPRTLEVGTYTGQVRVALSLAGESVTLPVTLVVADATPQLGLSQAGLSFTAVAGAGPSPRQAVRVYLEPTPPMPFFTPTLSWRAQSRVVSGSPEWLLLFGSNGTVTGANPVNALEVAVDASRLTPGDYFGQVLVETVGIPGAAVRALTVALRVVPAGTPVSPQARVGALVFVGEEGSSPLPQPLGLVNTSSQAVSFTTARSTTDGRDWITVAPASGNLAANQSVDLTVQADFRSLPAGTYRGAVTVTFADGSRRVADVTAFVRPRGTGVTAACAGPRQPGVALLAPAPGFSVALGEPVPVEAIVTDRCGNPFEEEQASVTAVFGNGDAALTLRAARGGVWSGTWVPQRADQAVSVAVLAVEQGEAPAAQAALSGTVRADGTAPAVSPGGVVSAAAQAASRPVAPGGLITVYGSRLASDVFSAVQLPLLTELGGVEVRLGDRPLPLLYVGPGQINAQVPADAALNAQLPLVVRRGTALSVPVPVTVAAAQPGVFTTNSSGRGQGVVIVAASNGVATAAAPAQAGEVVVIYATGLGAVTPPVEAGQAAPSDSVARVIGPVQVTIGGQSATVEFAGLTPGLAGLYQVNARVPVGVSGEVELRVTAAGQVSPPVTIGVR